MTAYLVVRAVVADPEDRAAFDHWYRTEHLPDAMKAFNAGSAMRGWSTNDPSVHTAFYRFDSVDAVRPIGDSSAINRRGRTVGHGRARVQLRFARAAPAWVHKYYNMYLHQPRRSTESGADRAGRSGY